MIEPDSAAQLSYADRKAIDKICDKFESEYLSGRKPDLKDYVSGLSKNLMQAGLIELISLDAFYRSSISAPSTHKNLNQTTKDCSGPGEHKSDVSDLWQHYVAIFPTLADVPVPIEFQTGIDDASLFGGRFKSIRRHASGGLGRISIASDLQFNRKVAIKEIHSTFASNRSYQQRFLREAEITGQLEHPGVVPVYVLGRQDNDEPYYVMRFIQGQSMFDAINELHSLQEQTSVLRSRRQLLNRLIDVCNTVEYAHSKGVIHRDIKPQNIMLGEFGETLLVDWGLAKHLSESDDLTAEALPSENDQSKTRSGTVLGTAGYMSPEQATGDIDSVNGLTDIYSLGATMFQLLTGKPAPVFGKDSNKHAWQLQLHSLFDEVRLSRPIKAICCKAMSLEADERYQSARALASDIELAMADEPVSVCEDPIWTRARRWIQRNPAMAASGFATVFLLFVSLIAFSSLTEMHAREVSSKNEQLDRLVVQETQLRIDAQQSEKRTSGAMDYLVDALRSPDPNLKGRDVRVIDLLETAIEMLDQDFSDDPLMQARVLNAIGLTWHQSGEYQESAKLLERARSLYLKHAGENDRLTLIAERNLAETWLKLGDRRATELMESVFEKSRQTWGAEDTDTLSFEKSLTKVWIENGKAKVAIETLERLLSLERESQGESSAGVYSLMNELAVAYAKDGQLSKAVDLAKLVYEQRLKQDGPFALKTIVNGFNYAHYLRQTGHRDDAVQILETVLTNARANLGTGHFETIRIMKELGKNYLDDADLHRGIPLIEEAYELTRSIYGEKHRLSLTSANSLGFAYMAQGDYEKTAKQFKTAYELYSSIHGPEHPETLTVANNLAAAYRLSKQHESAVSLFEMTLATQTEKLGREHPHTIRTMVNYISALQNANRYVDSIEVCHEVIELAEGLAQDHVYSQTAMSLQGAAHLREKDFESAKAVITQCHESRIRTMPNHWLRYHTMSTLGGALAGLRDFDGAEPLLIQSYEKLVELESKIPERAKFRIQDAKERLAELYIAKEMPEKAAEYQN